MKVSEQLKTALDRDVAKHGFARSSTMLRAITTALPAVAAMEQRLEELETAHECWYATCVDCGLFCRVCGRGYAKPLETATFTVTVWDHEHHAAAIRAAVSPETVEED